MRDIRRTVALIGTAALTLGAGAALAVPAVAADGTGDSAGDGDATLSVFHGVPDTTVDVYVDGAVTLDDFAPGDMAGPLELAPGTYSLAITAADAPDDSDPIIGPVDLPLEGGTSYTAVAHLTADGKPTATLFTNDTSDLPAGQGRLTVRHVAAAPAVDVLAGGDPVIENLSNPDEKSLELPAGTVSASVAATGTTDPVIGPADVAVTDGVSTIAYAWGSLDDGSLALAVQTIDGMGGTPSGIDTGETGQAAQAAQDSTRFALLAMGTLGIVLALLVGAAVTMGVKALREHRTDHPKI